MEGSFSILFLSSFWQGIELDSDPSHISPPPFPVTFLMAFESIVCVAPVIEYSTHFCISVPMYTNQKVIVLIIYNLFSLFVFKDIETNK